MGEAAEIERLLTELVNDILTLASARTDPETYGRNALDDLRSNVTASIKDLSRALSKTQEVGK